MMPIGREFCEIVQSLLHPKSVLEVGSKPAVGQEELANLRTVFTDAKRYVGVDMEAGPGVDLVADMCEHAFSDDEEYELSVCMDTLEHMRYPEEAVMTMASVSRHLILRVPFCAPIHLHPDDYWRFTPSLLHSMVSECYGSGFIAQDLPVIDVPSGQEYDWPHGVYAFGTGDEELRTKLIHMLQQRPRKDIMVVKSW